MEQVYWAIAKDVIKRDTVFSCVFPCRVYAHSGDRVSCIDNKGQTVIGDIIYADYCTKDSREIPELVDALGAYKVVTYWERTDFTKEEQAE